MDEIRNDRPIDTDKADYFQRYEFGKRIAQTFVEYRSEDGFVTAIYGKWGEGKTSVLKFVEKEIKDEKDIVLIHFNPWNFGDEQSLVKIFFEMLATALKEKLYTKKERFFSFAKGSEPLFEDAPAFLNDLADYGNLSSSFISPLTGMGTGLLKKGKGKDDVSVEKLKSRIESFLVKHKKRVIVVMDDIDRLDAAEIRGVFKLVKLTGNFKYISYLLAFDEMQIASVLAKSFGGDDPSVGISYLEKIVQVPLRLPMATRSDMHAFCMDRFKETFVELNFTADQVDQFDVSIKECLIPAFQTPRLIIRYINACLFSAPMMRGLVDPIEMMLVEGMKLVFPKVYDVVSKNQDSLVAAEGKIVIHSSADYDKEFKESLEQSCSEYGEFNGVAKSLLIRLFPETVKFFGEPFLYKKPNLSTIDAKMKICSRHFFARYFTYSVIKGDIPDTFFLEQISKLTTDQKANAHLVDSLFTDYGVSNVLYKIGEKITTIGNDKIPDLIKTISALAIRFPRTIHDHVPDDPATRAAKLITLLARNLDEPSRSEMIKVAALKSTPVEFGFSILSEIREENISSGVYKLDRVGLDDEFLSAMQEHQTQNELLGRLPMDTRKLLLIWSKRNTAELNEYISALIKNSKPSIVKLIKAFTPYNLTASNSTIAFVNFEKSNFEQMRSILDVKAVAHAIIHLFGEQMRSPTHKRLNDFDSVTDDNTLVEQFMVQYNAGKADKSS